MQVKIDWTGDLKFVADVNGHPITMDADPQFGGQNAGPRPKPLILAAIGGCSGMDVVSILEKMHVTVDAFSVDIDGETATTHPMYYNQVNITYCFVGKDLPFDKLKKAVDLSVETYCAVIAMVKRSAEIKVSISVNGEVTQI